MGDKWPHPDAITWLRTGMKDQLGAVALDGLEAFAAFVAREHPGWDDAAIMREWNRRAWFWLGLSSQKVSA